MTLKEAKDYTAWLGIMYLCALALRALINLTGYGLDDTDQADGTRSGLHLYTDAATGCQYLGTAQGGITPRQLPNGKHMGCR